MTRWPRSRRTAEGAGFAAVFVTDHPAPPARWVRGGGHVTTDPLVTLGFAAAATSTIRLQTNLFVPAYRHPLVAAKAVATLDLLSGGRVILGVGAGYLEPEFAAVDADFEHRNDVLDDALRTMQAAWSADDVDGVATTPRPVQQRTAGVDRRQQQASDPTRGRAGPGLGADAQPGCGGGASAHPGFSSRWTTSARGSTTCVSSATSRAATRAKLDVALMPSGLNMFAKATPAAAQVVDDIAALADIGVTWVTVALPADSRRDLLTAIESFGNDVIAAT